MIGIIVTGHGTFATGLTSGLKLLAGEPSDYAAVDFDPEESLEVLTEDLQNALDRLKACEGVLILADLTGGSPYNTAVRLKLGGADQIAVIGGASLPILLDAYMSRSMTSDPGVLARTSLEAGKAQTICFEVTAQEAEDDDEIEYED